jgi:hypothetical protein
MIKLFTYRNTLWKLARRRCVEFIIAKIDAYLFYPEFTEAKYVIKGLTFLCFYCKMLENSGLFSACQEVSAIVLRSLLFF